MGNAVLCVTAKISIVSTNQRPRVASLVFGGVFALP
jgi:hypothetical protein